MSDAPPHTPDQIAEQAIEAARVGATILHLHGRKPDHFTENLARIRAETNAVVSNSTGDKITITIDERLAPASTYSPEMCSMKFSIHPLANRCDT